MNSMSPIPNTMLVKQTTRGVSPWDTNESFYAVSREPNQAGHHFGLKLSEFSVQGNNVQPATGGDIYPEGTFEVVG